MSEPVQKPEAERGGLSCPACGCRHFRVIYTRRGRGLLLRRRECRNCGRRVTSYERIVG